MKNLFRLFALAMLVLVGLDSCTPTSNPPFVNSLNKQKTKSGILKLAADTNIYTFGLQCGCPFKLRIETADTVSILYDTTNIATKDYTHIIKAFARPGLAYGTYTGSLALVTVK